MFSQQIRKLAHLFVVVFEVIYKCVGIDDNNKLWDGHLALLQYGCVFMIIDDNIQTQDLLAGW